MDLPTVTEDARGVDIGQLRAQLRLSVPERVRTMVAAANVMISIREAACGTPQSVRS